MTSVLQLSNFIMLNKRLVMIIAFLLILTIVVAMLVFPTEIALAGPAPSPNYGCNCG